MAVPEPDTLQSAHSLLNPRRDISNAFHYPAAESRMAPFCNPDIRPKFRIDARKPIFVIGSCFALEIANRLSDMGSDIAAFNFQMSTEEWHAPSSVIVNKFTPATIHNEISWCHRILMRGDGFQPADADDLLYDVGDGMVIDGSLMGLKPVRKERALARRAALFDYFSRAFAAEAVVITLGLIESWWDSERRRFIEEVPQNPALLSRHGDQFHFCKLDFQRCLDYLLETVRLLDSVGTPKKVLITTSPVPIVRTFTDDDVIVANTYGKSMLRTVCGALADHCPNVDYFPSYESVVLTRDWSVYAADRRHVASPAVARVVAKVIDAYFDHVPEPHRDLTASVMALHDGALDRATALAERVTQALPNSIQAWHQLAQCHDRAGAYGPAAAAMNRVYLLAPDKDVALYLLTESYIKADLAQQAVDLLEQYLEGHIALPMVEMALLKGLHAVGRWEDCLALIRRLTDLKVLTGEGHLVASHVHEALGDMESALQAARVAVRATWRSDESLARVAELETKLAADG